MAVRMNQSMVAKDRHNAVHNLQRDEEYSLDEALEKQIVDEKWGVEVKEGAKDPEDFDPASVTSATTEKELMQLTVPKLDAVIEALKLEGLSNAKKEEKAAAIVASFAFDASEVTVDELELLTEEELALVAEHHKVEIEEGAEHTAVLEAVTEAMKD